MKTENIQKTKVLLTGASGTIGSEVLKQLAGNKNISLTVFDIKNSKTRKIFNPYFKSNIKFIYGDLTNLDDIQKVTKNQDVVIHLAAIIPPLADENPQLAYKVNVLGTKNLIKALERDSPSSFFMYSSSISVYGDRVQNPNIRVSDPLVPSDFDEYAKTKIESEHLIQSSKLDWSIFRLAAIMKNHKISKLMFHMPLETTMEISTPEDTARAFVNGIREKESLKKRIFNLGGGKHFTTTFKEFLEKSFLIYGLGKLDFAPNTFATKNFHCGYYIDGDELEEIVHFRKDNLDSYFEKTKGNISPFTKIIASILRYPIKKYLQNQSEPLRAYKGKDNEMLNRFFIET